MRRLVVMVVSVALFVGVGASAAFAGEVTGNGKPTGAPTHANSMCAFSGLEDGSEPGTQGGPGNTQNWGHIPKEARGFLDHRGVPGVACNGHMSPQGLRTQEVGGRLAQAGCPLSSNSGGRVVLGILRLVR